MRRLLISLALILSVISLPVYAMQPVQDNSLEHLVNEVAEAYQAKDLGRLDSDRTYPGKIKIIMQHSLSEGQGEFVVKWVKSFAQAEKWLRSREMDGMPGRQTMPLIKCEKGACTYNFDGGILHNNLYLKKITYGFRKGKPYIKSILLLNGD